MAPENSTFHRLTPCSSAAQPFEPCQQTPCHFPSWHVLSLSSPFLPELHLFACTLTSRDRTFGIDLEPVVTQPHPFRGMAPHKCFLRPRASSSKILAVVKEHGYTERLGRLWGTIRTFLGYWYPGLVTPIFTEVFVRLRLRGLFGRCSGILACHTNGACRDRPGKLSLRGFVLGRRRTTGREPEKQRERRFLEIALRKCSCCVPPERPLMQGKDVGLRKEMRRSGNILEGYFWNGTIGLIYLRRLFGPGVRIWEVCDFVSVRTRM